MPIQTSTNHYQESRYIVGVGSPYTTIQGAINAANAAGGGVILIRPGTYAENLTLYNGIVLEGIGEENAIIQGTHTPPNLGTIRFENIQFRGAASVLLSAAAGSALIFFYNCYFIVNDGFICNLPAWTSYLSFESCRGNSTEDGIVNFASTAELIIIDSQLGAGTTRTMTSSNIISIQQSVIGCPSSFSGANTGTFAGDSFSKTLTLSGNIISNIYGCTFGTGAGIAITTTSAGLTTLSDVIINSAAANVITGTGTVQFGSVTYLNSTGIIGTIVKDFTTRLETGILKLADTSSGALSATTGVVSAGTLSVPYGGTGVGTLLDHGVLVGSGIAAIDAIAVGATGELLTGVTGADPAFATSSNGNFTFTTAAAGTDRSLSVTNTDNTNIASHAHLQLTTGGAGGGDPYVNWLVTGAGTFSSGIDNSVSDTWRLTTGATPSAGINILGALGTQFDIFPNNNTVTPTVNIAAGEMESIAGNTMAINIGSGNQTGNSGKSSTKTITIGGNMNVSGWDQVQTLNLAALAVASNNAYLVVNIGSGAITGFAQHDINIGNGATSNNLFAVTKNIGIGNSVISGGLKQICTLGAASVNTANNTTLTVNVGTTTLAGAGTHSNIINVGTGTLNAAAGTKTVNIGTGTITAGTRNVNIGSLGANITIDANAQFGTASNQYRYLRFGGGNSSGYIYGYFPTLADGVHFGYNYYIDSTGTAYIPQPAQGTSRFTVRYEGFTFAAGSGGLAPTDVMGLNYQGLALFGIYYSTHEFSRAANPVYDTIKNTDNTSAASHSYMQIGTGGAGSGDPYLNFLIAGAGTFSVGIDNSDADKLKITSGATPSTASTLWEMTSGGDRVMPLQCSFYGYCSNPQANVTGDGTIWDNYYETEVWDQGGDHTVAAGGVKNFMTAPVTGKYFFKAGVYLQQVPAATDFTLEIVTTSRVYSIYSGAKTADVSNNLIFTGFCYAIMTAGDTAYSRCIVTGGAKTVDINSTIDSSFAGELSV